MFDQACHIGEVMPFSNLIAIGGKPVDGREPIFLSLTFNPNFGKAGANGWGTEYPSVLAWIEYGFCFIISYGSEC